MQNIGAQLEEARKRKGISLREAAEATKIRSDFLGHIEQNKMDFDLPDIYKRGFLKNYARYLKLDVDKIITDYNAHQLSQSRNGKRGGAELFGQMEIKKPLRELSYGGDVDNGSGDDHRNRSEESSAYGRIAAKPSPDSENEDAGEDEADKTFYMKIGLIFVGTLALVFVVFGLIWAILGSGESDSTANSSELRPILRAELDETTDTVQPAQSAEQASPLAADDNSITLIASGNVYVLVKQQSDNQELLRKTMSAGESITLDKDGAVDILFTAGENILIEHSGERMRPSTSGTAKITIK